MSDTETTELHLCLTVCHYKTILPLWSWRLTSVVFLHTFVISFFEDAYMGKRNQISVGDSSSHSRMDSQHLTCLHSLRHSVVMASSQQPSPTQPSDFLDTPGSKSYTRESALCHVDFFLWLLTITLCDTDLFTVTVNYENRFIFTYSEIFIFKREQR